MTPFRLVLLLVLAGGGSLVLLRRCGRDGPSADVPAGSPVGRWRLDREALLAQVGDVYRAEGPHVVQREQERARGVSLDMELRSDGRFAYRTLAVGIQTLCRGRWKQEGDRLLFLTLECDGKEPPPERERVPEEARLEGEQIEIAWPETRLRFTLVRHRPGDEGD